MSEKISYTIADNQGLTRIVECEINEEVAVSSTERIIRQTFISGPDLNESVLQEAERIINGPRKEAYGPAKESFNKIAEGWGLIIGAPVTAKQVALCMIWLKVMRHTQSSGRDDLVDIAGYAGLSENL